MGTFNFKAPVELWATMKDVARQEGISVSEMIRRAVGEWLARRERRASWGRLAAAALAWELWLGFGFGVAYGGALLAGVA
jgi:hypothetical protein